MRLTRKLTMRSLVISSLVLAQVVSPALSAAPLGDDQLIDPIRFKISDLGGGARLGNAPFKDVKDAITAHTLAGHVDEALSAFMVLINKHRGAVEPRDVYQGALLAKSAGEGGLATQLLHMYLGGIGWPERIGASDKMGITALSFLSTLQFEAGQELLCIRTLRTVTRLQLEPSPHHWSMLSTVLLRSGPPQEALSSLYPLLGHVPAVIAGGKAAPWPEYGLLTAAGGKEAYERLGGSVPHWGGQGENRIVEAHNLASELGALQFPKDGCRGRPLMLHTLGDRNSGWGMGSMLHVMSLALASAYAHNRTLVLPDKDEWWYADEACRPRGFGCYFEPISSCRQGDSTDIVGSHAYEVKKTYVPAKYARQGLLWWRSQLFKLIWRPLEWVDAELSSRMSRIGWPRNQQESVVACHVRRGDKVGGGRTGRFVIDMGVYKKELRMMVRQTAANIVYVGGDDQETVSEMAAFARNELGVTALFDDLESRSSKDNSAMMTLSHKVNITHYALDAICNVELLARAQHLVGTFGSHFTRMSHELSFARGGYRSPPVTLDTLWNLTTPPLSSYETSPIVKITLIASDSIGRTVSSSP